MHTLFDGLEFRVLRDRLFESLESEEEIDDSGFEMVGHAARPRRGRRLAPDARRPGRGRPARRTGVAVQGVWRAGGGEVWSVALAAQDGTAAWFDAAEITPEDDAAMAAWLGDATAPKVLHDAKGPMLALAARGWPLAGLVSDTALAAYLVRPDQRSYDLADLTLRYLKRELRQGTAEQDTGQGELTFDTLDGAGSPASARPRCCRPAPCSTWPRRSTRRSTSTAGRSCSPRSSCRWSTCSADLERTGIAVDTDHLESLESHFAGEVKRAAEEAFAVIGKEINLGSPKQLQVVLFDELDMPKTKRTKTGYTTDADALQQLYVKTEHPFLLALLRHRDVSRLRQTLEGLLKTVADDGRIHTTFNQLIAATGRLSSTDPNLQNIPIRTEEGRRIREGFVVGEGYECLMTADYSQIEMRIMAHLSEDALLIEAFRSGRDFHSITAARVFGVPADDVTVEMRAKIKAMNYGLAYGLSAFGLSQQLQIEPSEARGLMDEYFETFGGIRDYLGRGRRRGPPVRVHRDHPGPAPLPARPDQRQPPASRDGRADGAQRAHPGLGRRPDQGGDAQRRPRDRRGRAALTDAAPGPRRARVRGGAGGAGRPRRPGARADGRRRRPRRAARRVGRHRPELARGGSLSGRSPVRRGRASGPPRARCRGPASATGSAPAASRTGRRR